MAVDERKFFSEAKVMRQSSSTATPFQNGLSFGP